MDSRTIRLRVLTAQGLVLEDDAVSVVAPGEWGYLGILHNHAPLVTTLQPGTLAWRQPSGGRQARRIGAGLLEVSRNRLTILTDSVSEPSDAAHAARPVSVSPGA